MVSVEAPERLSCSARLATARAMAAFVDAPVGEEVLVLGREDGVDERRRDLRGVCE
jgi:hypothetical protein